MRVICLNTWGGTLHAPLIAWLATEGAQADVLCLQEVVQTPSATAAWLTYRDGDHVLAQRARLLDDIAAVLPGHRALFAPAAQGPLWDGDRAVPSFWGIATFVRIDLTIIAQAQGFVHGAFAAQGFGAHPRSRTAQVLRVFDAATGRTATLAQMHGLRDPAQGKADTPARQAQADRLAAMVTGVAAPGDPVVVCGDFNVDPGSQTFITLGRLGLRDLVSAGGHPGTRTSHYPKPGRFADYMLVNAAVPVRRFAVVRHPEVSDHCPLILDFAPDA